MLSAIMIVKNNVLWCEHGADSCGFYTAILELIGYAALAY